MEEIERAYQAVKDAEAARRKAELAAEQAQRMAKRQAALDEVSRELVNWYNERRTELDRLAGASALDPISVPGFISQRDETAFFVTESALFAWTREPGHFEGGGFGGVSFAVPGSRSMQAFMGKMSQPEYVEGRQNWVQYDAGKSIITSTRIVFIGGANNVEWRYENLVGFDIMHFTPDIEVELGMVRLQATNVSQGAALSLADLPLFVATFDAAINRFRDLPPPEPPELLPLEEFQSSFLELAGMFPEHARQDLAHRLRDSRDAQFFKSVPLEELGIDDDSASDLAAIASDKRLRHAFATALRLA